MGDKTFLWELCATPLQKLLGYRAPEGINGWIQSGNGNHILLEAPLPLFVSEFFDTHRWIELLCSGDEQCVCAFVCVCL